MSSALDRFERSLVAASLALSPPDTEAAPAGAAHRGWWRGLRSLHVGARITVGAFALALPAGAALAAYSAFEGGPARELPTFECEIGKMEGAVVNAVTGSPILDCAGSWASATGGRSAPPRLAIWGADNGQRLVAVVSPVSAGRPAGSTHFNWKRLPDSWTVNLRLVMLTDQLNNISMPFYGSAATPCSYISPDIARVRSLLQVDGLRSWQVTARPQAGRLVRGCRVVFADIQEATHNVELFQSAPVNERPPNAAGSASSSAARTVSHQQSMVSAAVETSRLERRLYNRVNAELARSCASVPRALALWRRAASRSGLSPATLAFWRAANTPPGQNATSIVKRYTLYVQPTSQHTGRCAHVLVMPGGIANVYVARFEP